jgi:choice-of-anchor A domain-containing protein
MKPFILRPGLALCCAAGALGASTQAATLTQLPDISLLTPYVELGKSMVESLTVVHGNVAVANGGKLQNNAPSYIYGDVYLGTSAHYSGPGHLVGSKHTGLNLTAAQNQVYAASATLGGLTPNVTFGSQLTSGLSYNVGAGSVQVVNRTRGLNLNNANIALTGAGYLVLNVASSFSLTGTASILAGAGADLTHILINYTGTGTVSTHIGDVVDGYFFMPNAAANLDGSWNGGLYGGSGTITLLSNAGLNGSSTVPDEGSSLLLLACGLACLALAGGGGKERLKAKG